VTALAALAVIFLALAVVALAVVALADRPADRECCHGRLTLGPPLEEDKKSTDFVDTLPGYLRGCGRQCDDNLRQILTGV
jgi:hypothetical protein